MLFSSSDYAVPIGRNAKRMMTHLSIPADDALQSTLSFSEKVSSQSQLVDVYQLVFLMAVSLHCVAEKNNIFSLADGG